MWPRLRESFGFGAFGTSDRDSVGAENHEGKHANIPQRRHFPSLRGATLGPIGPRVGAPVRNWPMHLANCAVVSVQRAEQLVSLAKGSSPIHTYHRFSTEQIHRTFTTHLPTACPREAERKLMGDAQNCAERAQDLCRKELRPPDFIGTFVPNFGCAGDQDPWRARGPDPEPKISSREIC